VERCLEKDPEDRYTSTRDLARDLASQREHLSESTLTGQMQATLPAGRRGMRALGFILLGAIVGFAAALFVRPAAHEATPTFRRLTFRRGTISSARFTPDGEAVVYSAAWDGATPEVFSVRLDGPESRSLGLPPAEVLSVSRTSDLAILTGRRVQWGFEGYGTLARVPLGGGTPREVAENVGEADWAPDGSFAISRNTGLRRRLEFPIGKVIYETAGWISSVHVAPDGKRVLFIDHPVRGDNTGTPMILDEQGALSRVGPNASFAAVWAADGDGVWLDGGTYVDRQGRKRKRMSAPGRSRLFDVSKQGLLLLSRDDFRREMVARGPGMKLEKNLTWLDWSHPDDLTHDGKAVLFDEQNQLDHDGNYTVYMRGLDGSPPTKLGIGASIALSPDGRWALTTAGSDGDLSLMPTGAGEARRIASLGVRSQFAAWLPDGEHILVSGSEKDHGNRLYLRDLGSTKPRAISPDGVQFFWPAVSPDGRRAVAIDPEGVPRLYPLEAGEPIAIPGVTANDAPLRWTPDGRSIYVVLGGEMPARVEIVDIATGQRRLWRELTPPDPTGVPTVGPVALSSDGLSYVYSYRRLLSDLFVAEGVR
jgi:Tol biopolymer transport system component